MNALGLVCFVGWILLTGVIVGLIVGEWHGWNASIRDILEARR